MAQAREKSSLCYCRVAFETEFTFCFRFLRLPLNKRSPILPVDNVLILPLIFRFSNDVRQKTPAEPLTVDVPLLHRLPMNVQSDSAIPENREFKKWKFSFYSQRHALSMSFDIFVVIYIYRVTNFMPKLINIIFCRKKMNFHFWFSPIFGLCHLTGVRVHVRPLSESNPKTAFLNLRKELVVFKFSDLQQQVSNTGTCFSLGGGVLNCAVRKQMFIMSKFK